jgi:3-oxoadipyl-CoA thiolase
MQEAFICDAIRTPIGRYAGALSQVRGDDLAAIPIKALMERNNGLEGKAVDDVIIGSTNQAGEDNRNVARMASLLAGLPESVPGITVNRLCASGMQAVADAARLIKSGEASLVIAGGMESMSRAPFAMTKSAKPFARDVQIFDTTIGWRFINPLMRKMYGVDPLPDTAQNVADEYNVSREDQDKMALASQEKAAKAIASGIMAEEIVPVAVPQKKGGPVIVDTDEHPRVVTLEALAKLKPITRPDGSVTAGNSSGVNDAACALIVANEAALKQYGLTPKARIVGAAAAGVPPRVMGIGPVPSTQKLLGRLSIPLSVFDVIELNEAFAAQGLAVLRLLGLKDDDPRVNPNGGAIALGHPPGMSGARLVTTAMYQLQRTRGKLALCTMCIGVGQGLSMVIERV